MRGIGTEAAARGEFEVESGTGRGALLTELCHTPRRGGMMGVVLLILMISGTVCGLVTATAIAVLVPNEERGTCLGAFMILGTLIGMGVSPILVSLGSQMLGGEAKLALSLAIVGVGVGVVSLAGFVIAMLNAPKPVPDATAD